jgi:hypothetical protein
MSEIQNHLKKGTYVLTFVISKSVLVACLMIFSQSIHLTAQTVSDNKVDIYGDFSLKIADGQKILEQATIIDTGNTKVVIDYEINSKRINTIYEVDPIKAANVTGEQLSKLYKGFVKAGFGTYSSPYGELFYTNLRSKKYQTGVHLKHLSSGGQIANVGYSGFSNNELNVFGKSFIKKSTLSGGIDYRRNVVHYYGFNTNPFDAFWNDSIGNQFSLEREAIKQRYQLVNLEASLTDNFPVDSHATKYKADINYYNYMDNYTAQENYFRAAGDVSFYYKDYDLNAKSSLDYYKHQNDIRESNMTIFNVQPQITFHKQKWRLKAGLNLYASSDTTFGFRLAPEVDFDLHLYENVIILNVGTDSKLKRNSYRTLTEENPFLITTVDPLNTWSPFRLYGGIRGALSSRMSFNLKTSYVKLENQYFFVNDTSTGNWNKLNAVIDNATLFQVNGEFTWQQNEKLRLIAKADYFGYTPDTELKAWHVPSLRLSFSGKYNLRNKIAITATILTLNRQFSREILTDSLTGNKSVFARELQGITDINLGAEYRYNKRLGMFVQLNNILNVRYQRYRDYPTQRFNLFAGISYSF